MWCSAQLIKNLLLYMAVINKHLKILSFMYSCHCSSCVKTKLQKLLFLNGLFQEEKSLSKF